MVYWYSIILNDLWISTFLSMKFSRIIKKDQNLTIIIPK